jgi:chitodextrinase
MKIRTKGLAVLACAVTVAGTTVGIAGASGRPERPAGAAPADGAVGAPADGAPPSVPAHPRTSNLTCNSLTFAWDASTDDVGVAGYDIYHDGQFMKSVDGTTTSTILTVVPNAQWGLYVNAGDAAGNLSQASDTVNITVPPCQADSVPPTTPGNLKGRASGTTVTLTWSPSTDNVGVVAYDVYRNGSLAGTLTGTPPGTTFTDSGLAASKPYDYTVVARDAQGRLPAPAQGSGAMRSPGAGDRPRRGVLPATPAPVASSRCQGPRAADRKKEMT